MHTEPDPYWPSSEAVAKDTLENLSKNSHAQIAASILYLKEMEYPTKELMVLTGFKDYTVRHYYGVAKKLIVPVKIMLHEEKISFSLARTIMSFDPAVQEVRTRDAIAKGTSVHRLRSKAAKEDRYADEDTEKYFQRTADVISEQAGFATTIVPKKQNKYAGTITFTYEDLRMFDAICDRLGVDLNEI